MDSCELNRRLNSKQEEGPTNADILNYTVLHLCAIFCNIILHHVVVAIFLCTSIFVTYNIVFGGGQYFLEKHALPHFFSLIKTRFLLVCQLLLGYCEHREADDGRQKTIFRLQRILPPLPPFVDDCFASLIVFEFLMR